VQVLLNILFIAAVMGSSVAIGLWVSFSKTWQSLLPFSVRTEAAMVLIRIGVFLTATLLADFLILYIAYSM
jgi:hypothetical protein